MGKNNFTNLSGTFSSVSSVSLGEVSTSVSLDSCCCSSTSTCGYVNPSQSYCTCPECGNKEALVDTSIVLTSYPPQFSYRCPSCGHTGTIFCDNTYYKVED